MAGVCVIFGGVLVFILYYFFPYFWSVVNETNMKWCYYEMITEIYLSSQKQRALQCGIIVN